MFNARTNAKHRALIDQILATVPDAKRTGFAASVNELRRQLRLGSPMKLDRIRPDAYRVNREAKEIELYEVEVRHALPEWKIEMLGEFWADWDDEERHDWVPVLIVVSRYGTHQRLDLADAYWRGGPFAQAA